MISKTFNQIIIEGIVGNNPEYRITQHGKEVAKFVIGTEDDLFTEKKRQWHNIVVVNTETISLVRAHILKGVKARITGTLFVHKQDSYPYKLVAEIIISSSDSIEIIKDEVEQKLAPFFYDN